MVPGMTLIVVAEGLDLSLRAAGYHTFGFSWLVAALVAGFSLSGSV